MASDIADHAHRPAYTAVHRALHWLVAGLVLGALATAFAREWFEGPVHHAITTVHVSFGVLVGALMVVRLVSRALVPPLPPGEPLPAAQRRAAASVHALLYATLLAQPAVGYLARSAFGEPTPVFWLVDLPPAIATDEALGHRLFDLHGILGWAIIALVAVHVSAAALHGLRGDGTLSRMVRG